MELTVKEAVAKIRDLVTSDLVKESEARHTLETRVEAIKGELERYTRQLPLLADGGGQRRDPDYKGGFPNEGMAADFGRFIVGMTHPSHAIRSMCAKELERSHYAFRSDDGKSVEAGEVLKAMGEGSGPGGGYLVPDAFARQLIRYVDTYGVLRQNITIVPMGSERQRWPKRTGGLSVYYPDEGVAATPSDVTLGAVTLTAKKWAVLTYYSRELEADSFITLGELLAFEMGLALAIAGDTNGFMGDGTSTYAGIVGVFNSPNVAVVTMADTKVSFEDLTHDDLVALKYAVPPWVRKMPDCGYYMNSGVAGICEALKDGNGRPLYAQPTEEMPLRIAGKPVRETEALPDSDASGVSTKFIAFGSLKAWGMLGQRRQISIEASREIKFLEDQVAVKAVPRQDIQEAAGEGMAVLRTAAA